MTGHRGFWRVPPEVKARVQSLRAEGLTIEQIATRLGIAKGTVGNLVAPDTRRSHGDPGPGRVRGRVRANALPPVEPETRAAIEQLGASGLTRAQIGARVGLSEYAVAKVLGAKRRTDERSE